MPARRLNRLVLVIAEAMSCGRPVVISDAGGAREIGEPERTCVAHPPGNVEALARQLERLINDAALRARLGAAAAVAVRSRFSRRQMGDALHAMYLETSHGRAG
jgi:glycosyltransferase involved in cell wall biosynthesis